MIYEFKILPEDIIRIIYAFCIDKRVHWDKVVEQFFKGGFIRKNLRISPFIRQQEKLCKRFWSSTRPELSGGMTQWNPITLKRELCPFTYGLGEWSIKNKSVVVTFTTERGFINRFSSKNPVSTWLKNINKFETAVRDGGEHWSDPLLKYLPKKKNNFGIKFKSLFYKNRAKKNDKIRKKREQLEKENLFIEERRKLKKKLCKFKLYQPVVLSFTETEKKKFGEKLKFYRGKITKIYLKQHRNNSGTLIFTKPKGNALNNDAVDNYIGEIKIQIRFEDGEILIYTPEKLLSRIKISNDELNFRLQPKHNFVRGWYTGRVRFLCSPNPFIGNIDKNFCTNCLEKITINTEIIGSVQYYITHDKRDTLCSVKKTYVLLNENYEFVRKCMFL